MKYTAILKGQERKIVINKNGNHLYDVQIDGVSHVIDARQCAPDLISVLLDHRSFDISFLIHKDEMELNVCNQNFEIQVLDERKMRMRNILTHLARSGPEIIKTSMPGKVVRVLVKPGDMVEPGAGVIIVEAMKMENEFRCLNAGTVKKIHVNNGQTVESEAVLVEIAPLENNT